MADEVYRNRDNLAYCKPYHIRLSSPAMGCPKKNNICDKKQYYLNECERVEVERWFSLAKRKGSLGLIMTKLEETISHSIAMSVVMLNLREIQHALLPVLYNWIFMDDHFRRIVFVQ